MKSDADEKLERVILKRLHDDHNIFITDAMTHLSKCDQVVVDEPTAEGTVCWNSTCDFIEMTAKLSCPHGRTGMFEYEEWGTMNELYAEMDCA